MKIRDIPAYLFALYIMGYGTLINASTPCDDYGNLIRKYNPTSQLNEYNQPNDRPLGVYDVILFNGSTRLEKVVPNGGLIIDLGGGTGRAMFELADTRNVDAVVINTQRVSSQQHPQMGSLTHRRGFAEEVLGLDQADVITDVWGAFSYTTEKVYLLEKIWSALRPGGEAFIFFHPTKTPAIVQTRSGKEVHLHVWLAERFPRIFNFWTAGTTNTGYNVEARNAAAQLGQVPVIIHLRKDTAASNLHIPLEVVSRRTEETRRNTLPSVTLREN